MLGSVVVNGATQTEEDTRRPKRQNRGASDSGLVKTRALARMDTFKFIFNVQELSTLPCKWLFSIPIQGPLACSRWEMGKMKTHDGCGTTI